jgi:hypothetical protein
VIEDEEMDEDEDEEEGEKGTQDMAVKGKRCCTCM